MVASECDTEGASKRQVEEAPSDARRAEWPFGSRDGQAGGEGSSEVLLPGLGLL